MSGHLATEDKAMFSTPKHPFVKLRKQVRQAGRQFRHNNDASASIFHPKQGFVYAYDLREVERALDEYETTLPSELQEELRDECPEHELLKQANLICATHPSVDARNFAGEVMAYLVSKDQDRTAETEGRPPNKNPLRLLKTEYLEEAEDVL